MVEVKSLMTNCRCMCRLIDLISPCTTRSWRAKHDYCSHLLLPTVTHSPQVQINEKIKRISEKSQIQMIVNDVFTYVEEKYSKIKITAM